MKRIKYLVKGLYNLAKAWMWRWLMQGYVFLKDHSEGEEREELEDWCILCAKASILCHDRYEAFMFAAKL